MHKYTGFVGGGGIEEHVSVCVPVLPWSLLLSIECEGRARGRLR